MSTINIRKAKREGARIVLALAGISGGGKTYTALQVAYGLTGGDASKIGLLDTENRRGSLYADTIKNSEGQVQEFWIGDLDAPFSPQRYINAIHEFQAAGIEVLVVDSITHEWEGTGGCEEIATIDPVTGNTRKQAAWNKAKAEHKRFMNALLQSDMHVIVCVRAREKVEMFKNAQGKTEYRALGVLPVQEKNFMFEMTASMMLWDSGRQRQVMKAPKELEAIFGECGPDFHAGYLGPKHGFTMRKWIMGGGQVDQEVEKARNVLRSYAEQGMKALEKAWSELPESARKKLGKCPDDIKSAAQAFDNAKRTDASDINEAIAGNEND